MNLSKQIEWLLDHPPTVYNKVAWECIANSAWFMWKIQPSYITEPVIEHLVSFAKKHNIDIPNEKTMLAVNINIELNKLNPNTALLNNLINNYYE